MYSRFSFLKLSKNRDVYKIFIDIEITIAVFQYQMDKNSHCFKCQVERPCFVNHVNLENCVVSVRFETRFRLHVIAQINDGSEKNRF